MIYPEVCEGAFLARPNRFIARVELGGEEITVHVKNTGRCRELLVPGAEVWLVFAAFRKSVTAAFVYARNFPFSFSGMTAAFSSLVIQSGRCTKKISFLRSLLSRI